MSLNFFYISIILLLSIHHIIISNIFLPLKGSRGGTKSPSTVLRKRFYARANAWKQVKEMTRSRQQFWELKSCSFISHDKWKVGIPIPLVKQSPKEIETPFLRFLMVKLFHLIRMVWSWNWCLVFGCNYDLWGEEGNRARTWELGEKIGIRIMRIRQEDLWVGMSGPVRVWKWGLSFSMGEIMWTVRMVPSPIS